ncbi:MAG TPA: DUF4173 domain-containing protein [Pyrinomonadaceae bacterium]|nr:DUF4173 domain-containing protein [Pyrinomonadaceae bacterium]
MSERTKQGMKVLQAALVLGVLGDALMRAQPWGLNVLLWVGAIVAAMVALLARWHRRRALSGESHLLLVTILLCAAAFAWRDSLALNFLAGVGMLTALALMAWRARGGQLRRAGLTEYALALATAGVNAFFFGFPALLMDVQWKQVPRSKWTRHFRAIALGAVMALPPLILFGGLLMSADAAFSGLVGDLFGGNHEEALGHILLAFALAWLAGGFLRGLLLGREVKMMDGRVVPPVYAQQVGNTVAEPLSLSAPPLAIKAEPLRLGIVEVGVTLGLLNLLFLTFVLSQLRYYFGDASLVQGSDGLTFAEYYRRGFFELVTVAALVLPLLLGLHWLLRKGNAAHERVFRLLAGAQVFLLFVMMASAVRRMLLYQREYGLTEQRLYTTAFMAWLALVFIWFVATALRGRREQFACGALVAGLLIIAALHVINPDALIVRVNMAHMREGRFFDVNYASSLSADATPALMEALASLNEMDRTALAANLLRNREAQGGVDWRSWNWSRSQSRRLVQENADALRAMKTLPALDRVNEAQLIEQQSVETVSQDKPPAMQGQMSARKNASGARSKARVAPVRRRR